MANGDAAPDPGAIDVAHLDADLRKSRRLLRAGGVPDRVLAGVRTRAQQSGRRTTGQHRSNRARRWRLHTEDPQYGTEADCKVIELRLFGMMLEFVNAPDVGDEARDLLASYLGKQPQAGTYRDVLTLERLDYEHFANEPPQHGTSEFHIGHDNPTLHPRHVPENISWRTLRSNLIQGNMTLVEARTRLVQLVARYFGLGEVTIHPDEII
ncbi:MAG: hypothetical protein QOD92_3157 [Acidimicrobiaceae bacterium]|jgi:hypothetical protein